RLWQEQAVGHDDGGIRVEVTEAPLFLFALQGNGREDGYAELFCDLMHRRLCEFQAPASGRARRLRIDGHDFVPRLVQRLQRGDREFRRSHENQVEGHSHILCALRFSRVTCLADIPPHPLLTAGQACFRRAENGRLNPPLSRMERQTGSRLRRIRALSPCHGAGREPASTFPGTAQPTTGDFRSFASFLNLRITMSRFSFGRWSMNRTPFRWSISCCRQVARTPSASTHFSLPSRSSAFTLMRAGRSTSA